MILLRSVSGAQQHRPAPARCNHSQPPARGPAGAGRRAIAAFRLTAVSTGTLGAGNRFGFASAGEKSQTPLAVVSRAAEHGLHLALARETAAATPERGGLEAPDCSSSALCVHPVGQDRLRQRGKHHQRSSIGIQHDARFGSRRRPPRAADDGPKLIWQRQGTFRPSRTTEKAEYICHIDACEGGEWGTMEQPATCDYLNAMREKYQHNSVPHLSHGPKMRVPRLSFPTKLTPRVSKSLIVIICSSILVLFCASRLCLVVSAPPTVSASLPPSSAWSSSRYSRCRSPAAALILVPLSWPAPSRGVSAASPG
jgi:hypothetical protein